jgi:hypothetical protein
MTGLVRKATLLCVCGVLLAGAAMAGVPSPANSQSPCILLMDLPNSTNNVGGNAGVCGQPALLVIVRDAGNAPVAGATVVVDFSACNASDVKLADTQSDPNVTLACAGKTATKTANGAGEVCFSLEGATNIVDLSSGHAQYSGFPVRNIGPSGSFLCAKIYADATLLATVPVMINKYDLDNDGTVVGGDGSYETDAIGANVGGLYATFGDYNCDGAVVGGDGSLHTDAIGNAVFGEAVYAGTYCP